METNTDAAAVAAASVPGTIFGLVIAVLMIVALWKIFQKAGEPGWASIIPFYNAFTLFRIAGLNPWLFLLLLRDGSSGWAEPEEPSRSSADLEEEVATFDGLGVPDCQPLHRACNGGRDGSLHLHGLDGRHTLVPLQTSSPTLDDQRHHTGERRRHLPRHRLARPLDRRPPLTGRSLRSRTDTTRIWPFTVQTTWRMPRSSGLTDRCETASKQRLAALQFDLRSPNPLPSAHAGTH